MSVRKGNTLISGSAETTTAWGNITGLLTNQTDLVNALLLKQNATDSSLQTTAKAIVSAINENYNNIQALSGVVNIEVLPTMPTTPVHATIYYIGSAPPYDVYLYTDTAGYTSLGSSSVDLSQYLKKSNIVEDAATGVITITL